MQIIVTQNRTRLGRNKHNVIGIQRGGNHMEKRLINNLNNRNDQNDRRLTEKRKRRKESKTYVREKRAVSLPQSQGRYRE